MKESNNHVVNHQSTFETGSAQHRRVIHEGVNYHCMQCDYEANFVGSLAQEKMTVKYFCKQFNHEANSRGSFAQHST